MHDTPHYSLDFSQTHQLLPRCVFWDFTSLSWNQTGCAFNRRKSVHERTLCECDHLTNFGIIFGNGDAEDYTMSLISMVLGSLSCLCLAITVAVQWFVRYFSTNISNNCGSGFFHFPLCLLNLGHQYLGPNGRLRRLTGTFPFSPARCYF